MQNTAIGEQAMQNSTGDYNVAIGYNSLSAAGAGDSNVAIGRSALAVTTSGASNIAIGDFAGVANTTGGSNVYFGSAAASNATEASNNVIIGTSAGGSFTSGGNNVAIGYASQGANQTGTGNITIGQKSGALITAHGNVCIGHYAGDAITTGTYNILLGRKANALTATSSNQFVAGSESYPINDIWFGKGPLSATATAYIIHGTGGSGTDKVGGNVVIAGGQGTGSGVGGDVIIQTAPVGASSAVLNALVERLRVTTAGNVRIALAGVPVYANNAAAIAGGLVAGELYRTNADPDPVCIVH